MKRNSMLVILSFLFFLTLVGCGKKIAPVLEQESSTTCTFSLSEEKFLPLFESQCTESRMKSKSVRKYFRALKALRYEEGDRIEREFINLETWSKEIESYQASDGLCASLIICGVS